MPSDRMREGWKVEGWKVEGWKVGRAWRGGLACCFLLLCVLRGEPLRPVPGIVRGAQGADLTLVLVGDVMLGRGVAQALDGDWEAAFREVRPLLLVDAHGLERDNVLAFANLESPLTAAPQVRDGHDLRAPPAAVAALGAAGVDKGCLFDAVSLANNHALDAGEAGLRETVRTLRVAGIVPWLDPAAAAAIGWTPAQAASGAPACQGLAFDDSVVPLDVQAAASLVAAATERAGVVIVSVHWGGEYQAAPSVRQRAIARALAGAGADVIVGHGPHVLQPVEWVGETLVAYSLGNFLFDQPYPADCRWGAILHVTLREGRVVAAGPNRPFEVFPTVAWHGRVRPADPETAAAVLERLGVGSRE